MKIFPFNYFLIVTILIETHQTTNSSLWENSLKNDDTNRLNLAPRSIFEEVISKYKLIDRIDYLGYEKIYWSDDEIYHNNSYGVVSYDDIITTNTNKYILPSLYDVNQERYLNDLSHLDDDEAVQVLDSVHVMLNSRYVQQLLSLSLMHMLHYTTHINTYILVAVYAMVLSAYTSTFSKAVMVTYSVVINTNKINKLLIKIYHMY